MVVHEPARCCKCLVQTTDQYTVSSKLGREAYCRKCFKSYAEALPKMKTTEPPNVKVRNATSKEDVEEALGLRDSTAQQAAEEIGAKTGAKLASDVRELQEVNLQLARDLEEQKETNAYQRATIDEQVREIRILDEAFKAACVLYNLPMEATPREVVALLTVAKERNDLLEEVNRENAAEVKELVGDRLLLDSGRIRLRQTQGVFLRPMFLTLKKIDLREAIRTAKGSPDVEAIESEEIEEGAAPRVEHRRPSAIDG